jgi:hypothetical protein
MDGSRPTGRGICGYQSQNQCARVVYCAHFSQRTLERSVKYSTCIRTGHVDMYVSIQAQSCGCVYINPLPSNCSFWQGFWQGSLSGFPTLLIGSLCLSDKSNSQPASNKKADEVPWALSQLSESCGGDKGVLKGPASNLKLGT